MACYNFTNIVGESFQYHTKWAGDACVGYGVTATIVAIVEQNAQQELVVLLFIAHKIECKLLSHCGPPTRVSLILLVVQIVDKQAVGCWLVSEEKVWKEQR